MNKTPRKLKSAIETLNNLRGPNDVDRHVVIGLFSDLRQAIEVLKVQKDNEISTLLTVCDWMQHNQLDRKKHYHILQRVSENLANNLSNVDISEVVAKVFGPIVYGKGILLGVNKMVGMCKLPIVQIGESTYLAIMKVLISELIEKPITAYSEDVTSLTLEEAKKKIGVDTEIIATQVSIVEEYSEHKCMLRFDVRVVVADGDFLRIATEIKL